MPEFFFQRYVNGERMADDVLITKQATLEDAIPAALRLCWNSPKSVLVYIPQTPWRDIESAPKDGTPILCVKKGSGFQPEILGFEDGVFGWLNEDMSFSYNPDNQPTHWMPLQEPPR